MYGKKRKERLTKRFIFIHFSSDVTKKFNAQKLVTQQNKLNLLFFFLLQLQVEQVRLSLARKWQCSKIIFLKLFSYYQIKYSKESCSLD